MHDHRRRSRTPDEVLGPDTDEPPRQDGSYLSERAADAAAKAALNAIRDTTTDFIPGRNWICRLSGAEQHSKHVQSAIQSGRMRRAFLKGMGMQRNGGVGGAQLVQTALLGVSRSTCGGRGSRAPELLEPTLGNRRTHGCRQRLIEGDVVPTQQNLAEDFIGADQVVQIGLRILR